MYWKKWWCPYTLADNVELDEKYFPRNHKGCKIEGVKSKHSGMPAIKRGISDEQLCLLTGVERGGTAFLHAFNMSRPSSEDIMNLSEHMEMDSYVWTDGLASYHKLLEEKNCTTKVVKSKEEYDKVNHLNNVNSFHNQIQQQYTKYRGVASKYINRYAALFVIQKEYKDYDKQERLLDLICRLRNRVSYFFIRQLATEDIFALAF
ncbi:IS1595 family transposase [[Eubacterium] hominis]|uniref:IS1595 family transposase n=1 Tax=[Eubacterium] hominis TaxID=2764325 RepID=UPI003A4DFC3E